MLLVHCLEAAVNPLIGTIPRCPWVVILLFYYWIVYFHSLLVLLARAMSAHALSFDYGNRAPNKNGHREL